MPLNLLPAQPTPRQRRQRLLRAAVLVHHPGCASPLRGEIILVGQASVFIRYRIGEQTRTQWFHPVDRPGPDRGRCYGEPDVRYELAEG
jgi:hypothetical protein